MFNPIAMHEVGKARRADLLKFSQQSFDAAASVREPGPASRLSLRPVLGGAIAMAVLITILLV